MHQSSSQRNQVWILDAFRKAPSPSGAAISHPYFSYHISWWLNILCSLQETNSVLNFLVLEVFWWNSCCWLNLHTCFLLQTPDILQKSKSNTAVFPLFSPLPFPSNYLILHFPFIHKNTTKTYFFPLTLHTFHFPRLKTHFLTYRTLFPLKNHSKSYKWHILCVFGILALSR